MNNPNWNIHGLKFLFYLIILTCENFSRQIINGLVCGDLQHLSYFQDVALEAIQLYDFGVAAAFAEILLGDLPQCVAVLDRVRPARGFGFRRDRLAHEGVISPHKSIVPMKFSRSKQVTVIIVV